MDIAIVGLGCRFPQAKDPVEYWELIRSGRVAFGPVPASRWNHATFFDPSTRAPDKAYIDQGAFLTDEDLREFGALHFGLAPRRVQVTDPQQRLFLDAVRGALQDAGYEQRAWDRSRAGVFVGASVSEHKEILLSRVRAMQLFDGSFGRPPRGSELEKIRDAVIEGVVPMRAFSMAGSLLNMNAAIVAQQLDLGGPALSIDAACSSALVATQQAVVNLRAGQIDLAVAGGVYLNLLPDNLVSFSRIGAISRSGRCKPFDANADGFVMGEGVGCVVLKRREDAERDGDRIYALIRGAASNNDGRSDGPMTPRQGGQLEVLRQAYRDAGVSPLSVGFLETHGTATTVGDVVEVGALRQLYDEAGWKSGGARAALGSVKANIGHTMSAAGIAGLIKASLALHREKLPPQPSVDEENPKLDLGAGPFFLAREERAWESDGAPRRAGVSSFGFGGTNVHVVLEEAPQPARGARPARPVRRAELFLVSGPRASVVARSARALAAALPALERDGITLTDVAFSLTRRGAQDARLAVVAESFAQLSQRLLAAAAALDQRDAGHEPMAPPAPSPVAQLLPGAVFAQGPQKPGKLALLFPGQGAQRVGLLREAYAELPAFRERLDALDEALGPELHAQLGGTLRSFLYAEPTDANEKRLMQTEVCQPVMAALGLALHGLLEELGIRAEIMLGHSLGEFAAAAAAGTFSPEDCVRLVARRGLSMVAMELADPGAMASAAADRETVTAAIAGVAGVVAANFNHPKQTVISGTTAGIAAAVQALDGRGIQTTALDVSHAFHSPLMAGVAEAMRPLVEALEVRTPRAIVVSAITGRPAGDDTREIWIDHATASVDFIGALRTASQLGARSWVQVGAGGALSGFVKATLPEAERPLNVALASREEDGLAQLHGALGQLWAAGHPLSFAPLFAGRDARLSTLPPSAVETQPYWPLERKNAAPVELGVAPQPAAGGEMDAMVALFREQVALLQQQARVLEQQAQAMAARGAQLPQAAAAVLSVPALPATPTAPPTQELPPPPASLAVQAGGEERARRTILTSVSRISAFPVEAIQPAQTLAGDLGFDSLMTVELDGDIHKAFPGIGGLPRTLLGPKTSVQDVIDHVAKALTAPRTATPAPTISAALDAVASAGPELFRFVPTTVEVPLAAIPFEPALPRALLLTRDAHGIADALAVKLVRTGHVAVVADLSAPASAPSRQAEGTWMMGGADDVLGRASAAAGSIGGIVHLSPAGRAEGDLLPSWDGLLAAHRLARGQRDGKLFVALTARGGRFAGSAIDAALAGYVKSLGRERPDEIVKCIDVRLEDGAESIASAILAELRSGSGSPEAGWVDGRRYEPELQPAAPGAPVAVGASDVALVTGGSRGIGLKLAAELARTGCAVALVGRGAPDAAALETIRAAGGMAAWVQWDVTRPAEGALEAARKELGAFTVLLHAAGITEDGPAQGTDESSILRVLAPKVQGLEHALLALAQDPLRLLIATSSWAGRFGNAGQVAYAAANAALSRELTLLHARRPSLHTLSLEYPPWSGSTMVAKIPPLARQLLAEQGVPFIDDAAGTAALTEALATGASGPVLLAQARPVRRISTRARLRISRREHLYLEDHQLAGQPVLPAAAALDLLASAAPGEGALLVRDFKLQQAVRVTDEVVLDLRAIGTARPHAEIAVTLGTPAAYSAFVARGAEAAAALASVSPAPEAAGKPTLPLALDEFYGSTTFHGPRMQAIESIEQIGPHGIVGLVRTSKPADWLREPTRSEWAVDPLALDGAFQLAAYWAWTHLQRAGYPIGIDEYVQVAPSGDGPLRASLTLEQSAGDNVRGTIVLQDPSGRVVAVARGVEAEFKHRDPRFLRGRAAALKPVVPAVPAVPPENYKVEEWPEVQELEQRLGLAAAFGLKNPYFNVHERVTNDTSVIGGRTMINWSSYNYLGLSGDPNVTRAAQDAVERYGTSVSASRVASGEKPLHLELERELASFLGTEDAVVTVSGHGVFVTVIATLMKDGDLILHDSLAHDCILAGAKLSGAKRRPFPHNDWQALEKQLQQLRPHYRRVLIAIEGVYSMDGDIPDLPRFVELKKKYGALLLVDEAHSIGVLGPNGRGIGEHFDVHRADVDLWMGTLSKSFASCGGYVGASKTLVQYLKYSAGGFVYSVGISPANAAAALESLHQMRQHPEKVARLHERAKLFVRLAKEKGIDTGMSDGSAVVPAILGNSFHALQVSDGLKQRGINVQPILYPAVEETAARLRFFCTATHTEQQIRETVDILAEEIERVRSADLQTGSE